MAVSLTTSAEGSPAAEFSADIEDVETQILGPGRTAQVIVPVRLVCAATLWVHATVDPRHAIANNLRTAPSLVMQVMPQLVPQVVVALTILQEDAIGTVTVDPLALCPGKKLVAEVDVANRGCAASPNTAIVVSLEDPVGVFPVVLQRQRFGANLSPGASVRVRATFVTPAVASRSLMVRALATAPALAGTQCDPATLVTAISKPLSSGGPPQLSLTLLDVGVLHPGEIPRLRWSIQNRCTDIGDATVRILFGLPPTELYRTQTAIPLQTTVEETAESPGLSIPPTVARDFWSVGGKTLTLEIVGGSSAPATYSSTLTFNVVGEPVDETWWAWRALPTPPNFFWKTNYSIFGTFTNRGRAAFTITSIDTVEHPTDVSGTGSDDVLAPLGGAPTSAVAPGALLGLVWSQVQDWAWLTPIFFAEVGPRSRTFEYTPRADLVDSFGNVYSGIVFFRLAVPVRVHPDKIRRWEGAEVCISVGLAALAVAAVLVLTLPYPANLIGGAIAAAAGMAAIIVGTLLGYEAMDPPIPEFRTFRARPFDLTEWELSEGSAAHEYRAIETLFRLLVRVHRVWQDVAESRDRAWAAFLDGDEEKRKEWRNRAHKAVERLRHLTHALAETADEARTEWTAVLRLLRPEGGGKWTDHLAEIEPTRILEEVRKLGERMRVPPAELAVVERVLTAVDRHHVARIVKRLGAVPFSEIPAALDQAVDQLAAELDEREYVR